MSNVSSVTPKMTTQCHRGSAWSTNSSSTIVTSNSSESSKSHCQSEAGTENSSWVTLNDLSKNSIVQKFCSETSLGGFAEWMRTPRLRLFWTVVIVFFTGFAVEQIYMMLRNYVDYPYISVSEPVDYQNLSLPLITVCPQVVLSVDKLKQLFNRVPEIVFSTVKIPRIRSAVSLTKMTSDIQGLNWLNFNGDEINAVSNLTKSTTVKSALAANWAYSEPDTMRQSTDVIVAMLLRKSFADVVEASEQDPAVENMKATKAWQPTYIKHYTWVDRMSFYETRMTDWDHREMIWLKFLDVSYRFMIKIGNKYPQQCYDELMARDLMVNKTVSVLEEVKACVKVFLQSGWADQLHKTIAPYVTNGPGQFDLAKMLIEAAFDIDEIFESCTIGGLFAECSSIIKIILSPQMGICYVVDLGDKVQTKPQSGFSALINAQTGQKNRLIGSGVISQLVGDGIMVKMGGSGGATTYVSSRTVSQLSIKESTFDRSVTKSAGGCLDEMENAAIGVFEYSVPQCQTECNDQIVFEKCGCVGLRLHSDLRNASSTPMCLRQDSYKCRGKTTRSADGKSGEQTYEKCLQSCAPSCKERSFDVAMNFHHFPSANGVKSISHLFSYLASVHARSKLVALRKAFDAKQYDTFLEMMADTDYTIFLENKQKTSRFVMSLPKKVLGVDWSDSNEVNKTVLTRQSLLSLDPDSWHLNLRYSGVDYQSMFAKLIRMNHKELKQNSGYYRDMSGFNDVPLWDDGLGKSIYNAERLPSAGVWVNWAHGASTSIRTGSDMFTMMEDVNHIATSRDISILTDYTLRFKEQLGVRPRPDQVYVSQECTPGGLPNTCKQMRDDVAEQWANDHLILMVAHQKLQIFRVKQEVKATFVDLVGQTGGLVGLFLGGSLVSLTHLIVFVFEVCCPCLKQKLETPDDEECKAYTNKKTLRRVRDLEAENDDLEHRVEKLENILSKMQYSQRGPNNPIYEKTDYGHNQQRIRPILY